MSTRLAVLIFAFLWSALAQAQVVEYVHTDALGSPVAITNEAGQLIERSDYEPYGNLIGKANNDRPGYTGHVMDSATGLTYMQQRYYDPTIGRFLSVDPVTAYEKPGQNFNRYMYANNSPYRFTDPDGRCPVACPNDIVNPPTIEQAAKVVDWIADGLDLLDRGVMSLPDGQIEHAAVGPVVVGLRGLATEARAAQLAKNVAQGAKAEKAVAKAMGEQVAGKRVTLEASTGQRSVADIVTKDKSVVEVKSGNSPLSPGQKAIKADIEAGRPVMPRGNNAANAGLEPGKPTQMKCFDEKRC
ncbi:RHS repeat domain-containing protein [Solilutibacter silvestris]|nr:RHS repeat-associated core domain-containing protein [Lysobacter silvestris]